MNIYPIFISCLFALNTSALEISTKEDIASSNEERQKLMGTLNQYKISLNWNHAPFKAQNNKESKWGKLPHLGKINSILFSIKPSKYKGEFYLPKAQYFEFLGEYIEPSKLLVPYDLKENSNIRLMILDTFTDIDALFSFDLTLRFPSNYKGEAFGEIWVADSYKAQVGNINFSFIACRPSFIAPKFI